MVTKLERATSSVEFPKGDSTCMLYNCTMYVHVHILCTVLREQSLIIAKKKNLLDIAVFYTAYFVHSGDITTDCMYIPLTDELCY